MKIILALSLALMVGSAFSQNDYAQNQQTGPGDGSQKMELAQPGVRHMLEFNVESALRGALSFDKIKTRGSDSDNNTNLDLSLNYAYGVHRYLQVGMRFNYFSGVNGTEEEENMDLALGGILNSSEDFTRSAFAALYAGAGSAQQFGNDASRDDLRFATLSVGKRIPLDRWGIKGVTYTPEIALHMTNSVTNESLDYEQSLQVRFLQFSVFF